MNKVKSMTENGMRPPVTDAHLDLAFDLEKQRAYGNETLNAYKIYTSSEKDTNISWINNKKIKINDTELKNYYYKK